jgi:ornithine decarboxylase
MELCLKTGFKSDQILYANTMKSINDIKEAPNYGVKMTTVDSVEGVEQIAATKNWSPDILVRLAVNDSGAQSPFSIKFGALQSEWKKIVSAIDYYQLNFKGVSFHCGSQANPEAFSDAILMCREFQISLNRYLPIVDVGGGFLPDKKIFKETAKYINKQKWDWEQAGKAPQKWISEPGRFFSSPVQTLYVPVVFKKESDENVRYILDDSLYGQFTNIVFDHAKPAWYVTNNKLEKTKRPNTNKAALFFGKTCDSADFIFVEPNAPKYEIGDVFVFPNMGSYTNATASPFNGFMPPKCIYTNESIPTKLIPNKSIIYPMSLKSEITLSVANKLV